MKRIVFDKSIPKELLECSLCKGDSMLIFSSVEVGGYFLLECRECGAYSEVMDSEVLEKHLHQPPKKIGDGQARWVSQISTKIKMKHKLKFK